MCRVHSQRAEHTDATVDHYPNDTHKATAIPKAKQVEAAATGEIGNGKLDFGEKRLDFRSDAYDFSTHIPWPLTFELSRLP